MKGLSIGVGMPRIYLMSIKPKFAYEIFSGKKRYELRRIWGPEIEEGSLVVVYASGSIKAIVGEFYAKRIVKGDARSVWKAVASSPLAGLDEDDWPYIRGSKRAMAIEVSNARLYPRPVKLSELRRILPGWNPPLSFTELREGDPLLELVVKKMRSWRISLGGRNSAISL